MKPRNLFPLILVCILIITLLLSACMRSTQSFYKNDPDFHFVKKDADGIALYVYIPEVKKVKNAESRDKRLYWADDWFANRANEGLNQPIPHQVTNVESEILSDTVESSHEWALSLVFDLATAGYTHTTSKSITIEKEFSQQKTYGPVMINPGYKCRLIALLITDVEEGVFTGDLYQKKAILLGHKWTLFKKDFQFGHWKKSTENLCYEFQIQPLKENE